MIAVIARNPHTTLTVRKRHSALLGRMMDVQGDQEMEIGTASAQ